MKRLVGFSFALIILILANLLVFAEQTNQIPADLQQRAEDYLANIKNSIIDYPDDWGYTSSEEITSVVLGDGFYLKNLNLEMNNSFTRLAQMVDSNGRPAWLFTIDVNGKSFREFQYGIEYSGADYNMTTRSSSWELFGQARDRFKLLIQEKGITAAPFLYDIGGRYIFAASDGENEWALPVPMPDEESAESWQSNQLWTAEQIAQTLKNFQLISKPGLIGPRPDFSRKPDMTIAVLLGYLWLLIPLGVLLIGLAFWLIKRKKMRGA